MNEAALFAQKALDDSTDMRREVNYLFEYLSGFGDIVDINFDYFPEQIIVTFSKHSDVLQLLQRQSITYTNINGKNWKFNINKITFTQPVRNCNLADDSTPNKFMPIYLDEEKIPILMNRNE